MKSATQEAQVIHTIESLETAVEKMFEHLNNRYIFNDDELEWKIQIGYKIGGSSNVLSDMS
jgi:hypothetical protein